MTVKDLMNERGTFLASGVIKNITGEKNKVYEKSGWMGSKCEITLDVNGRRQKIQIFGGVGKNEFPIRVFQKGDDGKILKDSNGKAIQHQIPVDSFDETKFMTFDKKEVIEWGERNDEGKSTKIEYISELTDGRFANAILDNKDMLIGKRVQVRGNASFKPTQNYDKIQTELIPNQIVLLKPVEEGKEVVDKFIINANIIINKEAISNVKDGYLPVYVPMYHKYIKPIKRDGKDVKGRNIYVPMTLVVNEKGFMGLDDNYGYDIESRGIMLLGKINSVCGNEPFSIVKACLSNKSGVVEREINIEELVDDQVYGKFAKKAIKEGDEAINNFLTMYKSQNPLTVRSEFKQEVQFILPTQYKDKDNNDVVREGILPIDIQSIELYTLEKIKEEDEIINAGKNNTVKPPLPNISTKKVDVAPIPKVDISEIDDLDSFPF